MATLYTTANQIVHNAKWGGANGTGAHAKWFTTTEWNTREWYKFKNAMKIMGFLEFFSIRRKHENNKNLYEIIMSSD